MLHGSNGPKHGDMHPNIFWMSTCFDHFYWFGRNLDTSHFNWLAYQIIFLSICGSSKTASICDLGVHFTTGCSWSLRWTQTWYRLGVQLALDTVVCLVRWWPRRKTSKGNLGVFFIFFGHTTIWARVPMVNIRPMIMITQLLAKNNAN
jgi:hypothetical protein